MKPPRNIPDLIRHLQGLCSGMEADPALSEPARHIRHAVLALENARRAAWEVCQESSGNRHPCDLDDILPPMQRGEELGEDAADWLRNLPPASPLKQ